MADFQLIVTQFWISIEMKNLRNVRNNSYKYNKRQQSEVKKKKK